MRCETQPYEKIIFFVNLYQTCFFVENRRNVHKTHTISFYYITNKYDKSKLETEEHVDDYFTCIYRVSQK